MDSGKTGIRKTTKRLPPALMPGDIIGIAAPASPFDLKAFYQGIAFLEGMGFSVFIPPGLFRRKGYLAGSDAHRADIIHRLFASPEVKAVFCARGGFGSLRVLPWIDFGIIRNNPKIFMGFSDVSALLSSFYTVCGLVTFHGPLAAGLSECDEQSLEGIFRAFSWEHRLEIMPSKPIVLKPGAAAGIVSGGNLCTLCHLLGTPFAPCYEGHILLIEERGEPGYRIDRMLTQMKLSGCFKGISGIILGSFEGCGPLHEIFKIVSNVFKNDPIPIMAGYGVGHGKSNLTLPLGIQAVLDTDRQGLVYQEPATRRV
jgi:muramoyltetrapeptide carboxypeptidase